MMYVLLCKLLYNHVPISCERVLGMLCVVRKTSAEIYMTVGVKHVFVVCLEFQIDECVITRVTSLIIVRVSDASECGFQARVCHD